MRSRNLPRRASGIAIAALLATLTTAAVAAAGSTEPAPPTNPGSASSSGQGEAVPGGVVPEVLDDDWFTAEGRLWGPQSSAVDDELQVAFCEFLVGTPEEIADVFGLDRLHLVDGSGFVVLGGGGTGYRCKYGLGDATDTTSTTETATGVTAADDTALDDTAPDDTGADEDPTVVEVVLWDKPLTVDADTSGVLEVFNLPPGEDTAAEDQATLLVIADGFNGDMIDAEFAERWLTAARDRMASGPQI